MTRWVIKVGTSLLRGSKGSSTAQVIQSYCSCIAASKERGDQVILVTSGAVGLGCIQLKIKNRPEDLIELQASAAVGQGHLMGLYEKAMKAHNFNVAQILLTRADLSSRKNYRNASNTLKKLLEWDVLPVINENDALSDEELRYGDNDTLSALVAIAVEADQLILLTDVDQLYSSDPKVDAKAKPISDVHYPNLLKTPEEDTQYLGNWGTGGIKTKLSAARIATASGITVHLADGRDSHKLEELLRGERGGTVFHPDPKPMKNRKSWLAHALKPLGNIYLDSGACEAIKSRGASLLLVGIQNIDGSFASNEAVRILNPEGQEIARGITSLSSESLTNALKSSLDSDRSPVVIHRDVLVIT